MFQNNTARDMNPNTTMKCVLPLTWFRRDTVMSPSIRLSSAQGYHTLLITKSKKAERPVDNLNAYGPRRQYWLAEKFTISSRRARKYT
jgi:hypothetical protein